METILLTPKSAKRDMQMLRKTTRKLVYATKTSTFYDEKAEAIALQIHKNYQHILDKTLKETMSQRRLC